MPTAAELDRVGATRITKGKMKGQLVCDLPWNRINVLWLSWNGLPDHDPRKIFSRSLRAYIDSGRVPRPQKKQKEPAVYFHPPLMTPDGPEPALIQEVTPEDTSTEPPFVPGRFHYRKPSC